jgi:hypothetical protein
MNPPNAEAEQEVLEDLATTAKDLNDEEVVGTSPASPD